MEAKLDNKVLVLTGGNDVHLVLLPYKGMTEGDVSVLQSIAEDQFNQGLMVVDVEQARDFYHAERILRRANGEAV